MTAGSIPQDGVYRLSRHGDVDVEPGVVDFAVNVRGEAPEFVRAAIVDACAHLASYPSAAHADLSLIHISEPTRPY